MKTPELEKNLGPPMADTHKFYNAADAADISLCCYVRGELDRAKEWATTLLSVAEDYYFGPWRDNPESGGKMSWGVPDRAYWDHVCTWTHNLDTVMACAAALGCWTAFERFATYLRDDVLLNVDQHESHRAWWLYFCGIVRGRPRTEIRPFRDAVLNAKQGKSEKLLLAWVDALEGKSDEALQSAAEAYFDHHRLAELKSLRFGIHSALALRASMLLHYGAHRGRHVSVPDNARVFLFDFAGALFGPFKADEAQGVDAQLYENPKSVHREIVDVRIYGSYFLVCDVRYGDRADTQILSLMLSVFPPNNSLFLPDSSLQWLSRISESELQAFEISKDRQSVVWPAIGGCVTISELEAFRAQNASRIRGRKHGTELVREALVTRTPQRLFPHVWHDVMAMCVYELNDDGTCRQRREHRAGAFDWPDTFTWKYEFNVLTIIQVLANPQPLSVTLAESSGCPGVTEVTHFVHEFRPIVFNHREIQFVASTRCVLYQLDATRIWERERRPKAWR